MDHADAVETRVADQLKPMLDQQLPVVFYDLTTVRIYGEGKVPNDVRAFGLNKETGGIARQFVLGVVQSADGLPLMHTVHAGNVAETKTLKSMLATVLQRFTVERVIVVADRGLLSLENVAELESLATATSRKLQFILAVPARRYRELGGTLEGLTFDPSKASIAEGTFAGQRLVVAHDPMRAAEQAARRRQKIAEIETFAEALVGKLNAQDQGATERGRKASDRGAYSRFVHAVNDAHLTRFVQADYQADLFSYSVDDTAIERAERFDGKLVLLTNVTDFDASRSSTATKSGRHRTRFSGAQKRSGNRTSVPPSARAHSRPRTHLLPRLGALSRHAHATQSPRLGAQPQDHVGNPAASAATPCPTRRSASDRHRQNIPSATGTVRGAQHKNSGLTPLLCHFCLWAHPPPCPSLQDL